MTLAILNRVLALETPKFLFEESTHEIKVNIKDKETTSDIKQNKNESTLLSNSSIHLRSFENQRNLNQKDQINNSNLQNRKRSSLILNKEKLSEFYEDLNETVRNSPNEIELKQYLNQHDEFKPILLDNHQREIDLKKIEFTDKLSNETKVSNLKQDGKLKDAQLEIKYLKEYKIESIDNNVNHMRSTENVKTRKPDENEHILIPSKLNKSINKLEVKIQEVNKPNRIGNQIISLNTKENKIILDNIPNFNASKPILIKSNSMYDLNKNNKRVENNLADSEEYKIEITLKDRENNRGINIDKSYNQNYNPQTFSKSDESYIEFEGTQRVHLKESNANLRNKELLDHQPRPKHVRFVSLDKTPTTNFRCFKLSMILIFIKC